MRFFPLTLTVLIAAHAATCASAAAEQVQEELPIHHQSSPHALQLSPSQEQEQEQERETREVLTKETKPTRERLPLLRNNNNRRLHNGKHHAHHQEKMLQQQKQKGAARNFNNTSVPGSSGPLGSSAKKLHIDGAARGSSVGPDYLSTDELVALANATSLGDRSIYDIAAGSEDNFSTLATAVGLAGFTETLSSDGTYTVFAPLNSAFDKLDDNLLTKLLDSVWQPQLQDLLQYHTLGSVVRSSDLVDGMAVATLNGEDITINLDPARVNGNSYILIDDELVDVEASNGIIHGIDTILIPTSVSSTIVDIASGNEDFSTLVEAVTAAGLGDALSGDGPMTVFAPTNEAFAALPAGTLDNLLLPENKDALAKILTYHIVAANAHSSSLASGDVKTLNGESVALGVSDAGVMVNGANVIRPDIIASNGIIHVIDKVLLPPSDADEEDPYLGLGPNNVESMSLPPILITGPVEGLPTAEEVEGSGTDMHTAKASKTKSSKLEDSKAKSSKLEDSKAKSSKADAPKAKSSKADASKADASKVEASKAKSSKAVHSAKAKSFKGKVHKNHAAKVHKTSDNIPPKSSSEPSTTESKTAKEGYSMPKSNSPKSPKKEHVAP
eukprot:CAMPEP_0172302678 /NCGR_PEP_ID=MMETSP1058-20130122/4338_1 /TAXON_ID=83371 /ORGANISM="Detonula confervacea, Strain CCMP 353" /LENGTH=613 /DNA_ID=CAMNT_0013013237 /DNA_START=173 /DNA_END=2011 /DNA_ORIENTATION=+